jgi:prepilin-type N-terminal cleavage/methylation domain-containing protein
MWARRAFTLVEVLVVVLMLGAVAVIAIPRLSVAVLHREQVEVDAAKLVAALRLTRQLAITNAATNSDGFELDMIGRAPYADYEIEDRKNRTVVASGTIDPDVACTGASRFRFGPLGNLEEHDRRGTDLVLTADDRTVTISVVPATGMVQCE